MDTACNHCLLCLVNANSLPKCGLHLPYRLRLFVELESSFVITKVRLLFFFVLHSLIRSVLPTFVSQIHLDSRKTDLAF